MSKIEKALEKKSDERATFENGKIYKRILEVIVIVTNIIYLLVPLKGIQSELSLNIIMFIINFSTFVGIIKTLKLGTFEGSINKVTFSMTTLYVLNFLGIIWGILDKIFKSHYLVADYMFLIGVPVMCIIELIQIIYINVKIKQINSISVI
jgi:hypothetical protein